MYLEDLILNNWQWLICYKTKPNQSHKAKPNPSGFDLFINIWFNYFKVWFNLVYLFNGISTPYGLFNTEIWLICKCFIIVISIHLFDLLNGISTPYGLFNLEIWLICKGLYLNFDKVRHNSALKCAFTYIMKGDCDRLIPPSVTRRIFLWYWESKF